MIKRRKDQPSRNGIHIKTGTREVLREIEELDEVKRYYTDLFNKLRNKISFKIILLTPELAKEKLANMRPNREKVRSHFKNLKYVILRKDYKLNGETIIEDEEGRLIDGQHRCQAVIDSGIPIPVILISGIQSDAFESIDQCAKRRSWQVIGMKGYKSPRALDGAVNWIWKYITGTMGSPGEKEKPSVEVRVRLLEAHPGLVESMDIVRTSDAAHLKGIPSVVAFCHYIGSLEDPKFADQFYTRLVTCEGLEPGMPETALVRALIHARHSVAKYQQAYLCDMIIRAWNSAKEGRRVETIKPLKIPNSRFAFFKGVPPEELKRITKEKAKGVLFAEE